MGASEEAEELLADLERRGVQLRIEGESLSIRAPRGTLTDDLRNRLSVLKPALLTRLRSASEDDQVILRVPRDGALEVTSEQRRLWFLQRLEPGMHAYNIAISIRLEGRLDDLALELALVEIWRRHENLRTVFATRDGEPVMRISAPETPLDFTHRDLRAESGDAADRASKIEAEAPFDLETGPLFRARLLQVGVQTHRLLVTAHHSIFDGWSTLVLVNELEALYAALVARRPAQLAELPFQYADFAFWQRRRQEGPSFERSLAYWREALADLPGSLELPTDRPRASAIGYAGRRTRLELEPALVRALIDLCKSEGVTLFMTLLAAFAAVLSRLAGQRDLCIGVPATNRTPADLERLMGLFVKTLLVRVDLSGAPTFTDLLQRVRSASLGAFSHQDVPFERIVAEVGAHGRGAENPLFQVMFNLMTFSDGRVVLPGLDAHLEETLPGSRFDLTLYAHHHGSALGLEVAYRTDLFDEERMVGLLVQIQAVLTQVVTHPHGAVEGFSLVTVGTRAKLPDPTVPLLAGWAHPLHESIRRRAFELPEHVAFAWGEESVSYRALEDRSAALAVALLGAGVRAEDRVAVLARREPGLGVVLLGILRAGAAFVILDAGHPEERRMACLRAVKAAALVVVGGAGDSSALRAGSAAPVVFSVTALGVGCEMGEAPPSPEPLPALESLPDDLAYVAFTSGTTGAPRGLLGTHRPLSHFAEWYSRELGLGPEDRVSVLSGLSHDPLLRDILVPLAAGATVVFPPGNEDEWLTDLGHFLAHERISITHLTPALARLVARGRSGPVALPDLRWAVFGGDLLTAADVTELQRAAPRITCANGYGATETPQLVGWLRVPRDISLPVRIPIGRGAPGADLLVIGPSGQLAGMGELGEIGVRTPYLARGYLDDDEATRARFCDDSFSGTHGARLFLTGDLGRFRLDGSVEVVGRSDRQVKIRGVRVELAELEAALRGHPDLAAAAIITRDRVEGDRELCAFVVARGAAPAPADLRSFLARMFPDPAIPGSFTIVDEIPLTRNGKLDQSRLPNASSLAEKSEPLGPLEEILSGLWARLLHCPSVPRWASFFDLGGHSLLAAQLLARVDEVLGVGLSLRAFLDNPTVAGMAAHLQAMERRGVSRELPALTRASWSGDRPASTVQERIHFLDRLEQGSAPFRLVQTVRLRGPLDVDVLARSLREIERRHEVLRTTLVTKDGTLVQRVGAPRTAVLEVVEQACPLEERAALALEWSRSEARRPFDLARGPLWRAMLLSFASDDAALLVTVHHAMADGASMVVFREELAQMYAAFANNLPSPLAELPLQYGDFAAWQQRCLFEGYLAGDLAHWRDDLAGVEPIELPAARSRPSTPSFIAVRACRVAPPALVESLSSLARQESSTLFMVILSGLAALLARVTGQTDLPIGAPMAHRTAAVLEGLIGLFLSTVVLRVDAGRDPTFRELLRRARATSLAAYSRGDVPFERVVEAVAPERDRSRTPLFQAYFNLFQAGPDRFALGNVSAEVLPRPDPPARYDLSLYAIDRADSLELDLVLSADLFAPDQAEELLALLLALLEAIVADPDRRLSALELSSSRHGDRPSACPPANLASSSWDGSLAGQLARVMRVRGAHTAIQTPATSLSYAELDALAERVARTLEGHLEVQARVGLLYRHGAEMIAGMIGALRAGHAYVPLDPSAPPERLAFMARDAEVSAVFTHTTCLDLARAIAPRGCPVFLLAEGASELPWRPRLEPSDASLAYILYTSGSTGHPKGVLQSRANLMGHVRAYTDALAIDQRDRLSLLSTYSFDASVMDIFGALLNGATLCPIDVSQHAARLQELIRGLGVTIYHSTPTVYRHIVDTTPAGALPLVRLVVLGGEPARRSDLAAFQGTFSRGAVFVNGLGPTESTLALQWFADHDTPVAREALPAGFPVRGTSVRLVTPVGEQVATYGVGEIEIRSPLVALGYHRRPELTEKAFSAAASPGERVYRTGDRGRWLPDGSLEFVGRIDGQVKVHGVRVELGEIEARLRDHPGVTEAVVIATRPEGLAVAETRLEAFFVRREGATPAMAELRAHLRATLPEPMVPSVITAVSELPRTRTGKLDRRAIEALRASDVPSDALPPRDALERDLADLWEEVLGHRPASVFDSFFDLGGHSLLAVRLMDRVRHRFGRDVALAELFREPTLDHLAACLRQDTDESSTLGAARVAVLRSSGDKGTLHAVTPPGSRSALHFGPLLRRLDPRRPLVGLEPPSFGTHGPLGTVEEAARRCREALPPAIGPLLLAGYSTGGVVAFELARQLLADGADVGALVLFDTPAPPSAQGRPPSPDLPLAAWVERFATHLARNLAELHGGRRADGLLVASVDFASLPLEGQLGRVLTAARARGVVRDDTALGELADAFDYYRRNNRRNAEVITRYTPGPYPGRLTLLRRRQPTGAPPSDPTLGWRHRVSGPIEVHELDGDHETMMEEPHVKILAEVLGQRLDETDALQEMLTGRSYARRG